MAEAVADTIAGRGRLIVEAGTGTGKTFAYLMPVLRAGRLAAGTEGLDEQRDCEAILTQLMAARAALDRVGLMIADNFVQECLATDDAAAARQRVGRVLEMVFSRFSVLHPINV